MSERIEPFVGPRPFEREDEKYFFGRKQAASELVSLVLAHSTVVLYAQSGAGKTSLLKAKVLSALERQQGFDVLPIARVHGQEADAGLGAAAANIYVANALRDLSDNALTPDERGKLTLAEYLAGRQRPPRPDDEFDEDDDEETRALAARNRPRVVIFDQFEELFTLYPERYADREDFFKQLRDALAQDSLLRVVFSMREDYIAELDPYVHLLPDSLRMRFRMERLRKGAALEAVVGPLLRYNEEAAKAGGEPLRYEEGVAEKLVDDLRIVKLHGGQGKVEFKGEFIEPVHLQIVCKAIWEKMLDEGHRAITLDDLETFGSVNQALTEYFERAIAKAAAAANVSEGKLRRWFDRVLITPENTRSTVLRGLTETAGIPNAAIDVLANERLIRSETRDNRDWYELSHDKLIEPVRESYQKWLLSRPADEQLRLRLVAKADRWIDSGRKDDSLLLGATELKDAARWINPDGEGYNEALAALAAASQSALDRAEHEREQARALERQKLAEAEAEVQREKAAYAEALALHQARSARRLRRMVIVLVIMLLLSFGAAGVAVKQTFSARGATREAARQKTIAVSSTAAARAELMIAQQPSEIQASVKSALGSLALNPNSIEGELALRHSLALLPEMVWKNDFNPMQVAFTPGEDGDITAVSEGQVEVFDRRGNVKYKLEGSDQEGVITLLSDDGRYMATMGNGEAQIKNLIDPREKISIISYAKEKPTGEHADKDELQNPTLTPDGRYLLGVMSQDRLRAWDTKTTLPVMDLQLSQAGVTGKDKFEAESLTISQDGNSVLIPGKKSVSVYKIDGGKHVLTAPIPKDPQFALSPKAKYLALAGGIDGRGATIKVLDVSAQNEAARWLLSRPVSQIVFSPDESYVATVGGNTVTVWDAKSGREITRVGHTVDVTSIVFSPDSKMLATTGEDRTTRLWNVRDGHEIFRMGHDDDVVAVSFSQDGHYLVTGSDDIRLWDISRTGQDYDISQEGAIDQVVLSHAAQYMAVTYVKPKEDQTTPPSTLPAQANAVKILETLTGREVANLSFGTSVLYHVVFSPDDKLLFTLTNKKIQAWGVPDGRLLEDHFMVEGISTTSDLTDDGRHAAFFTDDGRYAALYLWRPGVVLLIDLSAKGVSRRLPFSKASSGKLAVTPDGQKVLFAPNRSRDIFIWDATTNGVTTVAGVEEDMLSIKLSPDGRYLAYTTIVHTATVRAMTAVPGAISFPHIVWHVYDLSRGSEINEPLLGGDGFKSVAFSYGGEYAALTTSDGNRIGIFSLPTGKLISEPFVLENTGKLIVFSRDGKYVAAGGGGLVQIWSIDGKREVTRIEHGGSLRAIAITPDDKYAITGSSDQSVRLALLQIDDLKEIACKRTKGLTKDEWNKYFEGEEYRQVCADSK